MQSKTKKPEMLVIAGCLRGLSGFLTNFEQALLSAPGSECLCGHVFVYVCVGVGVGVGWGVLSVYLYDHELQYKSLVNVVQLDGCTELFGSVVQTGNR